MLNHVTTPTQKTNVDRKLSSDALVGEVVNLDGPDSAALLALLPPLVDDEFPEGDPVRRVEVLKVLRFGFAMGSATTAGLAGRKIESTTRRNLGESWHLSIYRLYSIYI
jgi:hypothetical protein